MRRLLEFARGSEDRGVIDLGEVVSRELDARLSRGKSLIDGSIAAEPVTIVASRELLYVAIAGVCDQVLEDHVSEEGIRSRVQSVEDCARWTIDLPGTPSQIWSHDTHETWMSALDRRGRDREVILRQGITLGALRRLGAKFEVSAQDTNRWSLAISFANESP
jgi:hypothetical protein